MPGFPTYIVGTPTHRGKARRYTGKNEDGARALHYNGKIKEGHDPFGCAQDKLFRLLPGIFDMVPLLVGGQPASESGRYNSVFIA